jgi:hypothetical protein
MKKTANVFWGVCVESEGIGQSPGIESLLLGHRNHSITSQVCHFSNYEENIFYLVKNLKVNLIFQDCI